MVPELVKVYDNVGNNVSVRGKYGVILENFNDCGVITVKGYGIN